MDFFYSEARSCVIDDSVNLESNFSFIICKLLDIEVPRSKSFGNGSASFSFANKVHLLLDMNVIDEKDKSKLLMFTSIRNQFAHNKEAKDYTLCFSFISGAENFLLKQYGHKIELLDGEEARNKRLYQFLYTELNDLIGKFIKALIIKHQAIQLADLDGKYIERIYAYAELDEEFKIKLDKISRV